MFTASEQQLLLSAKLSTEKEGGSSRDEIENFGKAYFSSFKLDWGEAFDSLLRKGDLLESNNQITMRNGLNIEDIVRRKPRYKYWYNDWYRLADHSQRHSALCSYAYGIDLCQTGMMTKGQIDYLCNLLKAEDNGLDVGCGIGKITEYIWSRTHANILGVDTIYSGIRLAQQRNTLSGGLKFELYDMRALVGSTHDRYDFIISMDTIYFIGKKFGAFIDDCITRLTNKGRLLVFYSAWDGKDPELDFDKNNFGKYLISNNMKFDHIDFTDDDHVHWRRKKDFLERNEASFASEGCEILHKRRLLEAEFFVTLVNNSLTKRYLYMVTI